MMWLGVTTALAASPVLSDAERSLLASGETVARIDLVHTTADSTAIIDISATPEKVMAAVVDLPSQVPDVTTLRDVDMYTSDSGRLGARWQTGALGQTMTFHVLYDVDRSANSCHFALDPGRDNEMVSMQGSYEIFPTPEGSRLVYHNVSDPGREAPGWLRRMLEQNVLVQQLVSIRRRAEGP